MTITSVDRDFLQSPTMRAVVERLKEATSNGGGVVLCGEPGTGRHLFAMAIHLASSTKNDFSVECLLSEAAAADHDSRPFVVVDCSEGATLELKLFGSRNPVAEAEIGGLDQITEDSAIRLAFNGTLILRQVPEIPGRLQMRLARLLRDGEVWVETKSGDRELHPVTLRPIGTTETCSDDERLIPDLRRRLEQTRIQLPPLRQRREDIPGLVRHLLRDLCETAGVPVKTASAQATELLSALPWRGNVSELRTFLTALVMNVPGALIRLADVLANVRLDGASASAVYAGTLKQARERFERDYVAQVLAQHNGRMAAAAKALGLQRTNLYRKIRQLDVRHRRDGRQSA